MGFLVLLKFELYGKSMNLACGNRDVVTGIDI